MTAQADPKVEDPPDPVPEGPAVGGINRAKDAEPMATDEEIDRWQKCENLTCMEGRLLIRLDASEAARKTAEGENRRLRDGIELLRDIIREEAEPVPSPKEAGK